MRRHNVVNIPFLVGTDDDVKAELCELFARETVQIAVQSVVYEARQGNLGDALEHLCRSETGRQWFMTKDPS